MLVTSLDQHAPEVPFTYSPCSLSEYYYTMTQNLPENQRLKVYGDVVHHVFPFTREEMQTYVGPNNPLPGMTVETGLDILFNGQPGFPGLQLPPGRTYADYDNWTTLGNYNHIYQPDQNPEARYVDLVIVCWRNIARDLVGNQNAPVLDYLRITNWLQPTRAGMGWDYPGQDVVVAGGYRLQTGFFGDGPPSGASIWFKDFLEETPKYRSTGIRDGSFRGLVHEIGHHLLGASHFTAGPWTMIANSDSRAYCPSAFVMADLGWIEPTMIYQNQTYDETITLGDLYTTGDAVAIEVNAAGNQWFFLENHQMLSPYDFTSAFDNVRDDGKGLYVLFHQDKKQYLQSASGAYDWAVDRVVNKLEWNNANVPVFTQGAVNIETGYTRSELIHVDVTQPDGTVKTVHPIILVEANNAERYTEENYFAGTYPGDQHEPCTSGHWGPATNPSNTFVYRETQAPTVISTETSFIIISDDNGTLQVRVANSNKDIIPPARVTSTTVPTTEIPDTVVAYPTPCTHTIVIDWSASIPETDFDHFLITGGDVPVTAPATATSATITITVAGNEGYASRWVDVYTVDASGNTSCNSIDGSKLCSVLSCPNNASKQAFQSLAQPGTSPKPIAIQRVYPQPARDRVTIDLTGLRHLTSLALLDALGNHFQLPYTTSMVSSDSSDSSLHVSLDITGMAPGLYNVVLTVNHGWHALPIIIY